MMEDEPSMPVHDWKQYRRKGLTHARPYVPGEDLTGVSVSSNDTPAVGGYIARNPEDPSDQWYINPTYFAANLEEVPGNAA